MKSPVQQILRELHQRYASLREGAVADYIPELTKANPDWFGICIATRDGHLYEIGDTRQKFTIQSISKALTYGLALEDRGEEHVLARVGTEPSGEAFNAISLKPGSGSPFNPMINAGAIATCGQILANGEGSRFERIRRYLSTCAGNDLEVDQEVYQSESRTGHRNRAIGWMLRNFDIIEEEPREVIETYFQQCSLKVTCADLAVMAATLANQGVNPLTGERAIRREYVDNILGVMATCGMYDWSGEWLYRVGLPAKSGVGGGIMAVLPGQLGIGVFSPPLDAKGNSARGIRVCIDLANELALHLFNPQVAPPPALRVSYNATQVVSRRRLPAAAFQTLRRYGERIRVMELQGPLVFSTFEPVLRALVRQAAYCRHVLLNFTHVVSADNVSLRLLAQMRENLAAEGVVLLCSAPGALRKALLASGFPAADLHDEHDAALERCENALLQEVLKENWRETKAVSLAETDLLLGCDPADVEWLAGLLEPRTCQPGDVIISKGTAADSLFFLLSGRVEVRLPSLHSNHYQRLDVLSTGMNFGEMAFIDGAPRSADIVAIEPVSCLEFGRAAFEQLDTLRPSLKIHMLTRISRHLSSRLRHANMELAALRKPPTPA
jgi:glutaminase